MHAIKDHAQVLGLLRGHALFHAVPEAALLPLAEAATVAHWVRGEELFCEGQQATGCHVVLSGLVKIFHITEDGRESVLHLVKPPATCGEAALLQGNTFPSSAAAVHASSTLFLPGAPFMELVRTQAGLAEPLLSKLALRIRMLTRKLQAQGGATRRLATYVLHRSRLEGGQRFELHGSRELLANMLGTARETLSRSFTRLVDMGAIEVEGKHVVVVNPKLLQEVAEGHAYLEKVNIKGEEYGRY